MANFSRNDYILMIVYINIILYATCYQLQRPLEPYLVDKLTSKISSSTSKSSSDEYARLQSFFSIVQTVGSLITGYILDKFSAKLGFIITFLSSALSYYILSISTSMELLYLSKIPTIFQAGFLCAQLAASQLTTDGADRVQALGRLTMCYTIGMILGPALGGWLGATGDYYFAAKLSAVGSLISAGLTLFMPASVPSVANSKPSQPSPTKPSSALKEAYFTIVKVVAAVWLLLSTKVLTGVANAMNGSAQPLALKNIYHFRETDLGLYMSLSSVLNTILSGFLLGPIIKNVFQGSTLLAVSTSLFYMSVLSLLLAVLTYIPISTLVGNMLPFSIWDPYFSNIVSTSVDNGLYSYIILSYCLSVFQFILSNTLTSESTQRVRDNEKGTLLGLEHSLFAAARVFAPFIGIYLLEQGGICLVSVASCGMFGAVFAMWKLFLHTLPALQSATVADPAATISASSPVGMKKATGFAIDERKDK